MNERNPEPIDDEPDFDERQYDAEKERCELHDADLTSEHGPKYPYTCPWCAGVA